ncbi:hypothetical protein FHS18_000330 [Paenibacillus phyllosphaerae]|uniref:Uncharacterized protein n=1 Tax=Paenibacillus phyllosphaerae TaxID=274593 RepID=A0A7W5ATF9_9BACL|nr:hypothetical protein [Paenibacillus phyllosphaerae]MBB3108302.1 hypothetical protein [Paenibacillus phyllosphaerae]
MGERNTGVPEIIIDHFGLEQQASTPEAMAKLAGSTFALSERVDDAAGEAFDFAAWYAAWRLEQGIGADQPHPTHLKVEAVDSFEAVIPWKQLESAAFLFRVDGAPLAKGGPLRLFTPNGSSECLNVKSVVVCRFIQDETLGDESVYGFKSTFSPQELFMKR